MTEVAALREFSRSRRESIALWMVVNTTWTYEQIGQHCFLDTKDVDAIADGEIWATPPLDPAEALEGR